VLNNLQKGICQNKRKFKKNIVGSPFQFHIGVPMLLAQVLTRTQLIFPSKT
jgi:hypothetical protein